MEDDAKMLLIDKKHFDHFVDRKTLLSEQVNSLLENHKDKQIREWLDTQDVCLILVVTKKTIIYLRTSCKILLTRLIQLVTT